MRRMALLGTFFALVAAVFFLWQHRFERSPDFATYRLADLRVHAVLGPGAEWRGTEAEPKIALRMSEAHSPVVARLEFPGIYPISNLLVRFRASAVNLAPGKQIWEDGRCIIEWHSPNSGSNWENDVFSSLRNDQGGEVGECVLRPERLPATPVLRLEHLGSTGEIELSMFEATVIRERGIWRTGRWFLIAAWLGWVAFWIGSVGGKRVIRPVVAGSVWLLMVVYFVVPGPWKTLHSFGQPFQIGMEKHSLRNTADALKPGSLLEPQVADPASRKMVPLGKIPESGDLTLRIKRYATKARPLLHSLLLFAPTLVIACLVGRKKAVPLMVGLALAIEFAQFSFGYGFDWLDVFDLFNDAVGIVLGILAYQALGKIKSPRWSVLIDLSAEKTPPLEQ